MKMRKESYNEQRKKQMEEEKLMLRNKENKGTCGCHLSFGFFGLKQLLLLFQCLLSNPSAS